MSVIDMIISPHFFQKCITNGMHKFIDLNVYLWIGVHKVENDNVQKHSGGKHKTDMLS